MRREAGLLTQALHECDSELFKYCYTARQDLAYVCCWVWLKSALRTNNMTGDEL